MGIIQYLIFRWKCYRYDICHIHLTLRELDESGSFCRTCEYLKYDARILDREESFKQRSAYILKLNELHQEKRSRRIEERKLELESKNNDNK